MNRRTRDENFSNCPLCGKKPYVKMKNEDYATCYCRGRLFCNHTLIRAYAWRDSKDGLYKKLDVEMERIGRVKTFQRDGAEKMAIFVTGDIHGDPSRRK